MHYPRRFNIGNISTSETELRDLLKAWLVISVAFALLFSKNVFAAGFYIRLAAAAVTVGTSFLLHELGHKIVAQKYGCLAEFRSFDSMLLLALVMSYAFHFVFAAPGAVMISGRVTKQRNGRISAAGPLVNLALALGFLVLSAASPSKIIGDVAAYGFSVNAWLALFNMIPFGLFDGAKIWRWNKLVYFSIAAAAASFMFIGR